jgi:hypothetical protein
MRAASFEMVRPIYYPSLTKGRSEDRNEGPNRISHRHQLNPVQSELAQHVVVEFPNACHGAAALDVVAIGRESIPESAAGGGDHGGLCVKVKGIVEARDKGTLHVMSNALPGCTCRRGANVLDALETGALRKPSASAFNVVSQLPLP